MSGEDLSGLTLVELYDLLEQPVAPDPVSMSPETVGWLWLLLAGLVLIAVAVRAYLRARRASAYRRAALVALGSAGDDPARIADVLRRTALVAFPRDAVAHLHGAGWLAFLDQAAERMNFADSEAGQVLAAAPYRPQEPHRDLPKMAEQWIRTHHGPGRK